MYGPKQLISQTIDAQKYRQQGESFVDSISRLTDHLVGDPYKLKIDELLLNQRFLPAGRIRNAMGAAKTVTAFNCYVMKDIPDSLIGIMDVLKEGALTMQMGGGTGYNFSQIRPKGDLIKSVGASASGPVSYMHIYDAMCKTIASAGERRGAMMFVLRVDHPDIEEYVAVKQQQGVLTGANISIGVTDEFMNAVISDGYFDLKFEGRIYDTVKARNLWDKIMTATWDWAEPGILFIDRINKQNNLWYIEDITATNPCAEQPLPPNGACLLGSFNLVKYVQRSQFNGNIDKNNKAGWEFNLGKLSSDVELAVRYLDSVIDNTIYPLDAQKQEALNKRRMGIGVTGVANAIELLGHPYGSRSFLDVLSTVLRTIRNSAYAASAKLAKEKGPFPLFDAELYLKAPFIQSLPFEVQTLIRTFGIRNSHLLSIAPTGTISLAADNISSGIEPVFSLQYSRKIITPDGEIETDVIDYAYREWGVKAKTALELTPDGHIAVLAVAQKYVDSAVSKTVNIGDEVTYEQFKDVYLNAYKSGAKGCTTFRAKGKRMGILNAKADQPTPAPANDFVLTGSDTAERCTFDAATGRKTCE